VPTPPAVVRRPALRRPEKPRTPLLRPARFFSEREPKFRHALLLVAAATVLLVVAVYAIGWVLTAHVDGTVLVDNPAHPGEAVCENPPDTGDWNCDEPPEVARNVDSIISDAVDRAVTQLFWAPLVGWLVLGTLLHLPSWFAGGDGGAGRSFAVTAWGLSTMFVSLPVGLAVLALTAEPATVTAATTPETFERAMLNSLGALQAYGTVTGFLTTLWTGVIWFWGLTVARDLSPGRALLVAGGVVVLLLLAGA